MWLNISAGDEAWTSSCDAVERAAEQVDVPLCVGGGVSTVADARDLLLAGADKVSTNTAPLDRPQLVRELADQFGSQCVVVAIDARAKRHVAGARLGRASPHRPRRSRGRTRRRRWGPASCW